MPGNRIAARGEPHPFLRWAGGKRWLARTLRPTLPSRFGTYFEPFLGSGAVFFALQPPRAHLSDSNRRLIEAFRVVRDSPVLLASLLSDFSYTKTEYYAVRASKPTSVIDRAAQLVYLNRTCWNGLYRVDRKGTFNVPYGRRGVFGPVDHDRLLQVSAALQGKSLRSEDFESALSSVQSGDLVFLDPPYTVTHGNNGFLLYNERIFSWSDQERLSRTVRAIDHRGAFFVLTNANHESVIGLYEGFDTVPLPRQSILAADPKRRRAVTELLISNFKITLGTVVSNSGS